MNAGSGASRTGALPRITFLALAGLLLGWGALSVLAARLADSGVPQLSLLLGQPVAGNGAGGAGSTAPAQAARLGERLTRRPLDHEAMAGIAEVQRAGGNNARAVVAMEEALRRNPRFRRARVWLLMHYLQAGRIADAIAQIDRLMVLVPSWRQQWLMSLALAAEAREAEPALLAALSRNPSWRESFFRSLPGAGVAPARIEALLEAAGRGGAGATLAEQGALLDAYLRAGDFFNARRVRARLAGSDLVFDPDFLGRAGLRPLSWFLMDEAAGSAEIREGRLEILLLGGKPVTLARQDLLLAPGRYRISTRIADGADAGAGDALAWRIECDRAPLAQLDLAGGTDAQEEFSVAADCARQRLMLRSARSEFTDRQSAAIEWVRIDRIG